MCGLRGILVCVEYDDLLEITLPRNLQCLDEVLVVTSPADLRTQALVAATPRARLHVTDAFYRRGAEFNKGWALEEGFDAMGREGWILILDADIVLPPGRAWPDRDPQRLYGARRRMLDDVSQWSPTLDWSTLPVGSNPAIVGYFQLFHADATAIATRPWYSTDWRHCGGSDDDFRCRWPEPQQVHLPFHVLHLGPQFRNWCGRTTPRRDGMELPVADRVAGMQRIYAQRRNFQEVIGDFERLPSEPVAPQLPRERVE